MTDKAQPPPAIIFLPTERMTDKQVRAHFEARHRALIIEDDWICELFEFSRRGRGVRSIPEIADVLRQLYYFARNPESKLLKLSNAMLVKEFSKMLIALDKTD